MELLSAKVKKVGLAVGEMSLLINYPDGSHTTLHQKIWTTPLTRLTAQDRKKSSNILSQIHGKGMENGRLLGVDVMDFLFKDNSRIVYTEKVTELNLF